MTPIAFPLSTAAVNAMRLARDEAQKLGHRHVGTGHALLGLARSTNNSLPSNANELLASEGFDVALAQRSFENIIGIGVNSPVGEIALDHKLQSVLKAAQKIALGEGRSFIETLDILEAMTESRSCDAAILLERQDFDPDSIRSRADFAIMERSSAKPFEASVSHVPAKSAPNRTL